VRATFYVFTFHESRITVGVGVISGGGGARVITGVIVGDAGVAVGVGKRRSGVGVSVHSIGVAVGCGGRGITVTTNPQIILRTTTALSIQRMT